MLKKWSNSTRKALSLLLILALMIPLTAAGAETTAFEKGDINGDGKVNAADLVLMRNHILGKSLLTGDAFARGDMDDNGKINSLDLVQLKARILGSGSGLAAFTPITDYRRKAGYISLSAAEKKVYEVLYAGVTKALTTVAEKEANIDLPGGIYGDEAIETVFWAMCNDNPQLVGFNHHRVRWSYLFSNNEIVGVTVLFSQPLSERIKNNQEFWPAVNRVLTQELKLTPDMDEYDIELEIHDWLAYRLTYDMPAAEAAGAAGTVPDAYEYAYSAHGAIVDARKSVVCEGFSKGFQALCFAAGIDCHTVTGTANGGPHMWNQVKINGSWTYVDVTFDTPIVVGGGKVVTHEFFNLTTAQISKTHKLDGRPGNAIVFPATDTSVGYKGS